MIEVKSMCFVYDVMVRTQTLNYSALLSLVFTLCQILNWAAEILRTHDQVTLEKLKYMK